jgi:uncharacterized LabA/DUF88 family protein
MSKKDKSAKQHTPGTKPGGARAHGQLKNNLVHVFVDDQNLFWGIVNDEKGRGYRIDFGDLLIQACRDGSGRPRGVKTAYIAGVIPDDDSFWEIAAKQGFTVRRGFLGAGGRSKQDDAYLITDMTKTLFTQEGPSTVVLVAGDADYVPPLKEALNQGWRTEAAFVGRGISSALDSVIHEFHIFRPIDVEHVR